MSLGFQRAGFDILAGFEHWDVAISCYKKNFTHPIEDVDLSDVNLSVQTIIKYNPDIIIGGGRLVKTFLEQEIGLKAIVQI